LADTPKMAYSSTPLRLQRSPFNIKMFSRNLLGLLILGGIIDVPFPVVTGLQDGSTLVQHNKCRLVLSIGRVDGTAMPPDWAASGARLVLPNLEVEFQADKAKERERLLGGPLQQQMALIPTIQPSFVGINGQTIVPVKAGAYCLSSSTFDERSPRKNFRFYLDFPEGALRNDVSLPAERIFFNIDCWVENDALIQARRKWTENEKELKDLQEFYEKLTVDSATEFQQVLRLRSLVLMTERIDLLLERQKDLDSQLPKRKIIMNDIIGSSSSFNDEDVIRGPSGVVFSNQDGYMTVKRYGGILNMREEYHIVGTFTIRDFSPSISD